MALYQVLLVVLWFLYYTMLYSYCTIPVLFTTIDIAISRFSTITITVTISMLYYTMLYYAKLCYTMLYYAKLHFTTLYYTITV